MLRIDLKNLKIATFLVSLLACVGMTDTFAADTAPVIPEVSHADIFLNPNDTNKSFDRVNDATDAKCVAKWDDTDKEYLLHNLDNTVVNDIYNDYDVYFNTDHNWPYIHLKDDHSDIWFIGIDTEGKSKLYETVQDAKNGCVRGDSESGDSDDDGGSGEDDTGKHENIYLTKEFKRVNIMDAIYYCRWNEDKKRYSLYFISDNEHFKVTDKNVRFEETSDLPYVVTDKETETKQYLGKDNKLYTTPADAKRSFETPKTTTVDETDTKTQPKAEPKTNPVQKQKTDPKKATGLDKIEIGAEVAGTVFFGLSQTCDGQKEVVLKILSELSSFIANAITIGSECSKSKYLLTLNSGMAAAIAGSRVSKILTLIKKLQILNNTKTNDSEDLESRDEQDFEGTLSVKEVNMANKLQTTAKRLNKYAQYFEHVLSLGCSCTKLSKSDWSTISKLCTMAVMACRTLDLYVDAAESDNHNIQAAAFAMAAATVVAPVAAIVFTMIGGEFDKSKVKV